MIWSNLRPLKILFHWYWCNFMVFCGIPYHLHWYNGEINQFLRALLTGRREKLNTVLLFLFVPISLWFPVERFRLAPFLCLSSLIYFTVFALPLFNSPSTHVKGLLETPEFDSCIIWTYLGFYLICARGMSWWRIMREKMTYPLFNSIYLFLHYSLCCRVKQG